MKNTYFVDIDGTLIYHHGSLESQVVVNAALLPGVKEKFVKWVDEDATIIITTGRRESLRAVTEQQLHDLKIPYDLLIMGIGRGQRVVINDLKPNSDNPTAVAYNPKRNVGLKDCPY